MSQTERPDEKHPQRCGTCREAYRLDGYPERVPHRFCNVKERYISKDDEQCYVGKTYINSIAGNASSAEQSFPDSTTLIQMAKTEWHNREERRGIHAEIPWTIGWISGYLTPRKDTAEQRIADAIGILEMQIGCSMMLDDDGDSELAYTQLRDECKKAISLLKEGGK